ncbi:MAG: Asp-tRNA(Asn)/Glu-tRNA(Gln) amidotransferase subunit GatB, partial [Elusimicrobiota bacterium]
MKTNGYFPVIGLEVHVELNTSSKMFCGCAVGFGAAPNQNICPVCTGQPGVLPVINRKAIEIAIKAALALNCRINTVSVFARKNYFYPDLPKNYQISQYEQPLGLSGYLEMGGYLRNISIKRVHIEEDTGKLLHAIGSRQMDYSLVDFNRSGIPLLEIVSEPDIFSVDEAYTYLSKLRNLLKFADISECDMEKGTLRCDANISVLKDAGQDKSQISEKELGTKTEIKNMNSFKAVKEALSYEFERQVGVIKEGGKIIQETRLWDEKTATTMSMRTKEQAHDYRYFQEPDLLPMSFDEGFIQSIKKQLPELPEKRKKRFIESYGITNYEAELLTSERALADYFEEVLGGDTSIAKESVNWIINELLGKLHSSGQGIKDSKVAPKAILELIHLMKNGTISGKIAKTVLEDMFETGLGPAEIVKKKGLLQIT